MKLNDNVMNNLPNVNQKQVEQSMETASYTVIRKVTKKQRADNPRL